jgi:hypothetical protein
MTRLRLVLGLAVLLALTAIATSALAAGPKSGTCSGGEIAARTYKGLTVTGTCTFPDTGTVTINGNLTVEPGAVLNDHAGAGAFVHVTGNATVGAGGVLGLGARRPGMPPRLFQLAPELPDTARSTAGRSPDHFFFGGGAK